MRKRWVGVLGVACLVVLAQAEDDARGNGGAQLIGNGRHGMQAAGRALQKAGMLLVEALELYAEVVEGEVRNRDAARDVLQVKNLAPQLLELLAAVLEVVHLARSLGLEDVLLARGGGIEQGHAPLDAALELDVLIQLHVRPEVDELDLPVPGAQTVDTAKTLNHTHGIPVNVVVHQTVAILQVLSLGDAVRGKNDVYLALGAGGLRQLLGGGAEVGQDVLEGGTRELEGIGAVGAARDLGALQAQLVLEHGRQLVEEVVRGVREGAEDQHLAVVLVVGVSDLLHDEVAQPRELGVTLWGYGVGVLEELAQDRNVEVQVLGQAQCVDVTQVNANLAARLELLHVIVVKAVRDALGVVGCARLARVQAMAQVLAALQDTVQRDAEGVHGGLHALEHVDPHEVGDGARTVHLALEVLAPGVAVAILILAAFVGANVGERLVLGKRELRNHVVELGDGRQLALRVDGRGDGEGLSALRERAAGGAVVLADVLAAAGDGEHVQQLEVVSVHRVDKALGGALLVWQLAPLVEARLGLAAHLGDGLDAVGVCQVGVISLGDELDLVAQVEQAVVHRRGREHEDLGAPAALDDVLDKARVAVLLLGVRRLVAEVVGLVDDQ